MLRPRCSSLVLTVVLAVFAAVAIPARSPAGVCSSPNSTVPIGIRLVGTTAGVPDPAGAFSVTVRDWGNNLVPNSVVSVDFSPCLSHVQLGAAQPYPGSIVDCPTHMVRAYTNASGVARFDIVGRGIPNFAAFNSRVTILADYYCLLGHLPVVTFDLDGVGGIGANDLALWTNYFLGANHPLVGDYDFNGALGANDLAVWVGVFFQAGSMTSPGVCP